MGQVILHKDGAYNLYSTVADGPCFEEALTLDELKEEIKEEQGNLGLRNFERRLEQAHKTGTSSMVGHDLKSMISGNTVGPGGKPMPYDEFIEKYLTLRTPPK